MHYLQWARTKVRTLWWHLHQECWNCPPDWIYPSKPRGSRRPANHQHAILQLAVACTRRRWAQIRAPCDRPTEAVLNERAAATAAGGNTPRVAVTATSIRTAAQANRRTQHFYAFGESSQEHQVFVWQVDEISQIATSATFRKSICEGSLPGSGLHEWHVSHLGCSQTTAQMPRVISTAATTGD